MVLRVVSMDDDDNFDGNDDDDNFDDDGGVGI